MIAQGDLYWADLDRPIGSEPGYSRPALVVQSDIFNDSPLKTVVCVMVTTNLRRADAPGNVFLPAWQVPGLPKDSVANVSQVYTLNKDRLRRRIGRLPEPLMDEVFEGLGQVLGRCAPPHSPLG